MLGMHQTGTIQATHIILARRAGGSGAARNGTSQRARLQQQLRHRPKYICSLDNVYIENMRDENNTVVDRARAHRHEPGSYCTLRTPRTSKWHIAPALALANQLAHYLRSKYSKSMSMVQPMRAIFCSTVAPAGKAVCPSVTMHARTRHTHTHTHTHTHEKPRSTNSVVSA